MSENSYLKLKDELEELQNAFDNETNPETAKEIEANISDVQKQLINGNYDLSIDDLFQCEQCASIQDIDDSVKVGQSYLCETCAK